MGEDDDVDATSPVSCAASHWHRRARKYRVHLVEVRPYEENCGTLLHDECDVRIEKFMTRHARLSVEAVRRRRLSRLRTSVDTYGGCIEVRERVEYQDAALRVKTRLRRPVDNTHTRNRMPGKQSCISARYMVYQGSSIGVPSLSSSAVNGVRMRLFQACLLIDNVLTAVTRTRIPCDASIVADDIVVTVEI